MMTYRGLLLLALLVAIIGLTIDGKCIGCFETEINQNRVKRAWNYPPLFFPSLFAYSYQSNSNDPYGLNNNVLYQSNNNNPSRVYGGQQNNHQSIFDYNLARARSYNPFLLPLLYSPHGINANQKNPLENDLFNMFRFFNSSVYGLLHPFASNPFASHYFHPYGYGGQRFAHAAHPAHSAR